MVDKRHGSAASFMNVQAQRRLFLSLDEAREASGVSVEKAADLMGVPTELMYRVYAGSEDMTLSELRQFAYSSGAVIHYLVETVGSEHGGT